MKKFFTNLVFAWKAFRYAFSSRYFDLKKEEYVIFGRPERHITAKQSNYYIRCIDENSYLLCYDFNGFEIILCEIEEQHTADEVMNVIKNGKFTFDISNVHYPSEDCVWIPTIATKRPMNYA